MSSASTSKLNVPSTEEMNMDVTPSNVVPLQPETPAPRQDPNIAEVPGDEPLPPESEAVTQNKLVRPEKAISLFLHHARENEDTGDYMEMSDKVGGMKRKMPGMFPGFDDEQHGKITDHIPSYTPEKSFKIYEYLKLDGGDIATAYNSEFQPTSATAENHMSLASKFSEMKLSKLDNATINYEIAVANFNGYKNKNKSITDIKFSGMDDVHLSKPLDSAAVDYSAASAPSGRHVLDPNIFTENVKTHGNIGSSRGGRDKGNEKYQNQSIQDKNDFAKALDSETITPEIDIEKINDTLYEIPVFNYPLNN